MIDPELQARIEAFQVQHGLPSRSRTLRALLSAALGDPRMQREVIEGEMLFRGRVKRAVGALIRDFQKRLPGYLAVEPDEPNEDDYELDAVEGGEAPPATADDILEVFEY